MRVRSGGSLTLSGFNLSNTGGRVELADLSSRLSLLGARITGGSIQGSGVLRPGSPGELQDVALSGVTVEIRDNEILDLRAGTLTNNGTIRLLDDAAIGGFASYLRTSGAVLIDGAGSIVFGSNGANAIARFSGSTLTIGANQTITTAIGGAGTIDTELLNQGALDANGGTITLSGSVAKTNAGVMRARSGGSLTLTGFTLTNGEGVISLASGATLNLLGAQITGGSIEGSGVLRPGFPGELQDVALEGVAVEIRDNEILDLRGGTLTNDGTIRLLDDAAITGLASYLRTRDAVRIEGAGAVVFGTNGANIIAGFSGSTLTVGAGQSIKTSGTASAGTIAVSLRNQGILDADGGTLTVAGALTHDGTLQARNGGLLDVQTDVSGTGRWNADGGTLRIAAGRSALTTGDVLVLPEGTLQLDGPRMTGATFLVDAGGGLDVGGTLATTAGLDARLTDPADWQWGPSSALEIANASGAPPGPWLGWAFVEVGGRDAGPAGSFSNPNFWLPRLVVGPQGRVFLSDEFDNGHRGPGGEPEALYVGSLVFTDPSGVLDLNGLHLYYQSLTGNPSQIIDVAVPPDRDRDGIPNGADNCPYWPGTAQADVDGNGIGDACECGDQSGDGRVDVRDLIAINLAIFGSVPVSPLCDTDNDTRCNVRDIVGANTKIFGRPAFCSRYPLPPP
jgi:hypothetical protein